MNEVQAAFGLMQLQHVDRLIARRAEIAALYHQRLAGVPGIRLMDTLPQTQPNHGYYPIFIDAPFPISRDEMYQKFREQGIFARRYFYPLISDMPMYRGLPSAARDRLPNAAMIAKQVLCLPIYPALTDEEVHRVADIILRVQVGHEATAA